MRYLKMLGLAALAVAALMAFVGAGTASAKEGVICSTTTNPCTSKWAVNTTLLFSLKPGTSLTVVNAAKPTETIDTCTGTGTTIHLDLTANPDATGTATLKGTGDVFEKCTFPTTPIKGFEGAFKVERIAGTSNGTVRTDAETRVTIHSVLFGSCVYGTKAGAHWGELTEGTAATPDEIRVKEATVEKLEGSNFACPPKTLLTATYVLTAPTNTTLSVSST